MLTKNTIKLIRSLEHKKNRAETGLFLAEGKKLVIDLVQSGFSIQEVYCTSPVLAELKNVENSLHIELIGKEELSKISFLKSTPEIIAVCRIPDLTVDWDEIMADLTLVLDTVQDPGNLGTIVRLADWFGIRNIICSEESADLYNPKVVQSTMGAFARVKVHYLSLPPFLRKARKNEIPIYGTFLHGENLYGSEITPNGLVVMGNEGNGISADIEGFISRKITIPNYPPSSPTSESLNVALATSVIVAEFRRRII